MQNRVPNDLEKAICNDNLIVFVGAGLSYGLFNINKQPLKGWTNLVEQMLGHLKQKGYDVDYLLPVLSRQPPIKVLDLIESDNNIPKKEISDFIKDFLDLAEDNDFTLHEKLYQLSNKIVTTNYDTAFEKAIPLLRKNRAYKGKNYELTKHKETGAPLLFKLHGCFEDVDSMVLFPSAYQNLYKNPTRDAEHSILVLKNIILNKSILFIGAGMGDFQINNLFEEIRKLQGDYNQKHFIITKTPIDSTLNFLTPISVSDYAEIETIIDQMISIKKNSIDKESEEMKQLRQQFEAIEMKLLKFETEINPNQTKLLEREAFKYLLKGVNCSLLGKHEEAIVEYETAVELKPDLHEAFYNCGNALGNSAKTKTGSEAEALYHQAFDKYQQAIQIKPDKHEAFNNWGIYLGNLAETKTGSEAEALYHQAFDKYQQAIQIKPDQQSAFYNWGNDLGNLAKTKTRSEVETLYHQAFDKYQQAIQIKPDKHEAFNNWGNALGNLAKTKTGSEVEALYYQAFDKYQQAIQIKPDKHSAFYNWGTYLAELAETKTGSEAEALYHQAFDKYQQAIQIKPDKHEAFSNWGIYLGNLAETKIGSEAEALYHQAFDKYQQAIQIKPDEHDAFYNWGTELGNLAKTKTGSEAETLYHQAFDKYQQAIQIKPDKREAFNNWGHDLGNLAKTKTGSEAKALYHQAIDKLQKAIECEGNSDDMDNIYAMKMEYELALKNLHDSIT
ncbi:tetratricopeptide repeat protein [Fulvivirgaceae bacterium PWU5]|uniref:Tetratricopeptide repeat protein n=1 Tax=Dawidia cretensis TaxID=2782350 RepID=A0AAP2GSI7_9BACT|nr:tetratricopeptide repeat protein [Dawidia cretensis]MBT1711776.1 tetratricopeptide repeat protein [Dawidia cretensis]